MTSACVCGAVQVVSRAELLVKVPPPSLLHANVSASPSGSLAVPYSVTVPPSATVSGSALAETLGARLGGSTLSMATVASLVAPAVTRGGSVPNPSVTDSPSSSTASCAARNVIDLSVSPLWKRTLPGTPE